jgi:Arc/MetJ-type ribon-helix-helix transcriptional regulator
MGSKKKARRRRPETTFYLGDDLYRALEDYRVMFKVPPTASALVREALRRFLEDVDRQEGALPPAAWVRATAPMMRHFRAGRVSVSNDQILEALEKTDRTTTLLDRK